MSLLPPVKLTLYCFVHVKFAQVITNRFTRFTRFSCSSPIVPVCECRASGEVWQAFTPLTGVYITVAHVSSLFNNLVSTQFKS